MSTKIGDSGPNMCTADADGRDGLNGRQESWLTISANSVNMTWASWNHKDGLN